MKNSLVSIAALGLSLFLTPTLLADMLSNGASPSTVVAKPDNRPLFVGDHFARTELYFGTARATTEAVSEAEFQGFLDGKITPAFPDGLTLLKGLGQFRGANGVTI